MTTELHFGRAAALLHMTQPPLTRQIQLLEHELGVRLLDRAGGSVRLTLAGRTFLREAEDILRRSEAAVLAARRALRADAGTVTVGFIPATSYALLPRLMDVARRQLPEVRLLLREMQTADQIEAIGAGTVELGIVRPFAQRGVAAARCLVREPFVVALPAGHALARRRTLPPAALENEPFVEYCPSESRYLYEVVAGRLRAEGVRPNTVHTLSHTHSILALVSAGMGIALVPRSAMGLRYRGVAYRPLDCEPALEVELHLAWRPHDRREVSDTLRDVLLQALAPPAGG
nr:LysR family transcriptional regulator [Xylophilus sp.]